MTLRGALVSRIDALHARVQDFERRRDVVGGVEHVEDRAVRPLQRRLQHEGQLDLDARRDESGRTECGAVVE